MTKQRTITAVDLFCGAGGATKALLEACKARGMKLKITGVNHWPLAIETHSKNHVYAEHVCADINEVNPYSLVPSGKLDILMAGVECIYFSTARGGKVINDQKRSTAWKILEWVEKVKIRTIIIENVPEFPRWGPLHLSGPNKDKPIKSKRGQVFLSFVNGLEAFGYKVEWKVLLAANYGDPTTRERFFLVATLGRHKPAWPEHTHSKTGKTDMFGQRYRRWVPAKKIIDWQDEGVSIFNREMYGLKPLSPNTMRRIFAGLSKFCGISFVLPNEGFHRGNAPRSKDEPLQTVTSRGGGSVVQPFLIMLNGTQDGQIGQSNRSVDEPVPALTTSGHIVLIDPFVLPQQSAGAPRSTDDPLPTVSAAGAIALIEPFVLNIRGGKDKYLRGSSTDQPLGTLTSKPAEALIVPFIVSHKHVNGETERIHDSGNPVPTLTAKPDLAVIQPFLMTLEHTTGNGKRREDGRRCYSADAPMPTLTGTNAWAVAVPFIVPNFGERETQEPRTHSVDDPAPTVTSRGAGNLIRPYLVAYHNGKNSENRTESVDSPLGTLDTSNRRALIQPYLVEYYGTGGAESIDDPLNTVTAKDRHALIVPEWLKDMKPGYKLLWIPGVGLMDIRHRMLRPRECARAHSFPDKYKFLGNQGDQMRMIGNSWPVKLGQAVCAAQLDALFPAKPKTRRKGKK